MLFVEMFLYIKHELCSYLRFNLLKKRSNFVTHCEPKEFQAALNNILGKSVSQQQGTVESKTLNGQCEMWPPGEMFDAFLIVMSS